jgi:hypothetical protein
MNIMEFSLSFFLDLFSPENREQNKERGSFTALTKQTMFNKADNV